MASKIDPSRFHVSRRGAAEVLALIVVLGAGACDGDEGGPVEPDVSDLVLTVDATTSRDSIVVTWAAVPGVASYRVDLVGAAGTLTQSVAGGARAAFGGVPDKTAYVARVSSVGSGGKTAVGTASVTSNHFPWDETYETSLHFTRAGKEKWYQASNGGFEKQMKVSAEKLYPGCQGCHRADQALGTTGCESCHDTPTPALGAKVDASLDGVCGQCHNRAVYEKKDHGYSDVHRDVEGFTCMACHTMGDVHGDGTAYSSMFDEGAIDAACENCHTTRENHLFHSAHQGTVDCMLCHAQTVLSCYNCHMDGALNTPPEKLARRRVVDWKFMMNYRGKVTPANVTTLEYGDETFVAIAPYFSHSIARNAVKSCGDCHGNANMVDLAADGILRVGTYDPVTTNIKTLRGVIPIPYNFEEALKFDFVTYDRGTKSWSLLQKDGPDRFQMLYGSPLTREQLAKLR